jgi:hypothetical protein
MGVFIMMVMGLYSNYKKTGVLIPFVTKHADSNNAKKALPKKQQTETKQRIDQYVLYLKSMDLELKALESTASTNLTKDLDLDKSYLKNLDNK